MARMKRIKKAAGQKIGAMKKGAAGAMLRLTEIRKGVVRWVKVQKTGAVGKAKGLNKAVDRGFKTAGKKAGEEVKRFGKRVESSSHKAGKASKTISRAGAAIRKASKPLSKAIAKHGKKGVAVALGTAVTTKIAHSTYKRRKRNK